MSALQVIELTQQLARRDARILELEKVINLAVKAYVVGVGWDDFWGSLDSIDFNLEKVS